MQLDKVVEVGYNPSKRDPNLPIEALTSGELQNRIPLMHQGRHQLLRFHLLVVCEDGDGLHEIDFAEHALRPGRVLHVRPGQTQRFLDHSNVMSRMILWPPESHPHAPAWFPDGPAPTSWDVEPDDQRKLLMWIDAINSEQQPPYQHSAQRSTMLKAMLATVLAKLDTLTGIAGPSSLPAPYRELRESLEARVFERPSVTTLARDLGYSTRTLDRACRAATNQSAKRLVDKRVELELRRQLADQSHPISSVRQAFGFTDASAFAKFTQRHLRVPPSEFRSRYS